MPTQTPLNTNLIQQAAANRAASGASTRNTTGTTTQNFNVQAPNPTVSPALKPATPQAPIASAKPPMITNYGQLSSQPSNLAISQPNAPQTPASQNIQQNYVPPQTSPQSSVQNSPYLNSDGTYNTDYVPTSYQDPAFNSVDSYTRNIYMANYLKSQGLNIDSSQLPKSATEEAKQTLDYNAQNQSLLDQQISAAKKTQLSQHQAAVAGLNSQFAQSREGAVSASNVAANQGGQASLNTAYSQAANQLQQQQLALEQAQKSGNAKLVDTLSSQVQAAQVRLQELGVQQTQQTEGLLNLLNSSGALANLSPKEQQFIQQGMPGVPQGIIQALSTASTRTVGNQQQQIQTQQQTSALNNVKNIAEMGVAITPEMAQQFSKQTGLSTDSFLNYNTAVQQIQQDKTLTAQQKQQQIQEAGYKLDQEQKGIFTQAQQNVDFLGKMYQNGASPEMISAFKSAAGITDQDDPKYQAQLALTKAQADIEQKKAQGIPITAEDRLNEVKANEELSYLNGGVGGSDTALVPHNPQEGIKVAVQDGKYTVTAPPDKQFQCGAFVNRCWGQKVFDSLGTQKMAVVDKMGFTTKGSSDEELANKVKPGMAFVMPIANNIYDHVGLVQSVTADGITTVEANANGKATTDSVGPGQSNVTSGRFIPWSQLYGFVPPPESAVQEVGKNADNYNDFLKEARDKGLPFDEAKKYATDKTTAALNNPTDTGPSITPTYAQYGLLANTDFNPGNQTDKYAAQYLDSYLKNGAFPSAKSLGISTSKESSGVFSNAATRANDLFFAATGQSLPDVQTLKANKDLINANNKLLNNLNLQEGTIGANFKMAIDNLDKNGINQDNQTINGWLNSMKNLMGDPATSQYLTQNTTLQNEVGNLLALRNASGTTVADKLESAGLVPANASEDQQKAILKTLMQEAENGRSAIKDASAELYKQIDPLERLDQNPNRKAPSSTVGDLQQTIQKAVDNHVHTTSIIKQLQSNPATKGWVNNALAHVTSPSDYEDIVNHFLKSKNVQE